MRLCSWQRLSAGARRKQRKKTRKARRASVCGRRRKMQQSTGSAKQQSSGSSRGRQRLVQTGCRKLKRTAAALVILSRMIVRISKQLQRSCALSS